jgi:hypothetical protein
MSASSRGLNKARLGTLLFELFSLGEAQNRRPVLDNPFRASQLRHEIDCYLEVSATEKLQIALFGAGTGAAPPSPLPTNQ